MVRRSLPRSFVPKVYMKHVMIDLETLATTADSVIMSIGAVKFNAHNNEIDDDGFYASVSIDSNLKLGRRISEATIQWWMMQPEEAQAVFSEPKSTLEDALQSMSDWLGHNKRFAWSKGSDFDLPMLAHAYTQLDMTIPWEFYNSRCVRTILKAPNAECVSAPANALKHNALQDAIAQAKHVQAVIQYLSGLRPVPMKLRSDAP